MVHWDVDNATPGGPTSEAVLLQWLETPGKYERFQNEPQLRVASEVVARLKAHGITTRTAGAVQCKILKMRSLCSAVDKWLPTGEYNAYHDGTAAKEVRDAVRKRFLHYDKLSPIFQAPARATKRARSADEGTETKKKKVTATPTSAPMDSAASVPARQAVVQPPRQLERSRTCDLTQEITELQPPGMRSQSAFGPHSVLDVKHIVFMGREGKQRLVNCEISRQEALARCHVEGEQKREEVRTTCEKLISRHKCLNAGVPEDVVDAAMPL